jgi:ubiquinone/menaquinone biosynthesis C-methylase UbiE
MATTASREKIRSDFDAIAALTPPAAGRLGPHECWLLEHIPHAGGSLLEIGCGDGHLTRELATAFQRTVALDFSEEMIRVARAHTPERYGVEFVCREMFDYLRGCGDSFDCVISSCTLHHVDLRAALRVMRDVLRPGGRLLILDVARRNGARHLAVNAIAWLVARMKEAAENRAGMPAELRNRWREHGRHETYLSVAEARAVATEELPGAAVRAHFLWRYSILWDKPDR